MELSQELVVANCRISPISELLPTLRGPESPVPTRVLAAPPVPTDHDRGALKSWC